MKATFYQRHAFKIILVAAVLFFPTMGGALHALRSNRNDVKQWLPAQYAETREFQWFRHHFAGEEFILASWDGLTLDDHRLRLLVEKLVPSPDGPKSPDKPPLFHSVITGPQMLARLTSEPINLTREEALARLKGSLIGPDGNATAVVFSLSEAGKENFQAAVIKVRNTAIQECNIDPAELHMGGAPVDNVAIDEAGEQSLYRLAGFAGIIGLAISWWCLRSPRLIFMVFSAGIFSAALSLAMVWYSPLLLGHLPGWLSMNAILMTMPSLVYVATISGSIHLANYYRDEVTGNTELSRAPARAVRHAWLPLLLATLTTSVGLLTLCYSELVPIQLFGLYSAIGVVGSASVLFLGLPAAFQLFPLRGMARQAREAAVHGQSGYHGPSDPLLSLRWEAVAQAIIGRFGWATVACLAVLGICAFGMTRIQTSVHLMRLFPPDAKILADYRWLEQNLGELVPMEIVLKIDPEKSKLTFLERMELVERIQRRVEQVDNVGSALSAVTFAPHLPRPEDYQRPGGIGGALMRVGGIKDPYKVARGQYNKYLQEHRGEFMEGDYLAVEDGVDLWRISARVGALKDVDYGEVLAQLQSEVEPLVAGNQGIQPVYTGLVPLIYKAQRSLLQGLIFGFVTDFILVTVVMMIAVRDWSAGLILGLPSIFPAIVVFGLMGWLGIVVDIGTVMAPAVALGVTVDDVVHYMVRYREGLKIKGANRKSAVMFAYRHLARPMYQSWGVIGLGLSVFALSPFTPTQRFGYLMVSLLTAALFGNLILLPALLVGPLGALFGRRYTRPRAEEQAGEEAEADRHAGPHGERVHAAQAVAREHLRSGISA